MSDDRLADRDHRDRLTLPPASPEDADIRTYVDGVTYNGPYWYVSCSREGEDATEIEFDSAEFEQPIDDLPDSVAEELRKRGMVWDSHTFEKQVWDGRIERMQIVPDAALEALSEEFDLVGYEPDHDGQDPDTWLYDDECPNCGPSTCIEVLGGPDLCYNCGTEVDDAE